MLGIRRILAEKLIGLRFPDDESFRKAVRIAVENGIPVDAVGYKTLVVQHEHKSLFKKAGIKFERRPASSSTARR